MQELSINDEIKIAIAANVDAKPLFVSSDDKALLAWISALFGVCEESQ